MCGSDNDNKINKKCDTEFSDDNVWNDFDDLNFRNHCLRDDVSCDTSSVSDVSDDCLRDVVSSQVGETDDFPSNDNDLFDGSMGDYSSANDDFGDERSEDVSQSGSEMVAVEDVEIVTDIRELLLDPDDRSVFVLEDTPGVEVSFEQLATVEYKGVLYAYMHPVSTVKTKKGKVIANPVDSTFYLDETVCPSVLRPVANIIVSNKVLTEYNRSILGKKPKNFIILKKNIYVKEK